ncbi:SHOCT domain-containing protein [Streptomyces sp. A7024]|uniref:SHOCT domain-containing protein n=1 Tax=Streptomyces coryli TaxID=1128680 RepID=A0A6G4U1E3_9ACTN|nr:SHOCT domain-containing protein [Streptomyces coryli]NGN65903.1 SHOCT domain-containing protein [Streptomyces coryli]
MDFLAHPGPDGGPGPWILLFPLMWAAVIAGFFFLMRRTVWRGRGRGAPWQQRERYSENSPVSMLGRRFASGEIDEDEYWRRLSVLNDEFGSSAGKGGAA